MSEFKVLGPFKVKILKKPGGRILETSNFWDTQRTLFAIKSKTGVYVFALKPARSQKYIPYYVGKATKSFEQETFATDKINKYQNALFQFARCSVAFFFIVSPTRRGPVNERHIKQIEDNFIQVGYLVNPNIENKHGTKQPSWSISGIVRSKTKKPSSAAKSFSEMFDLSHK
jgi:hypothetical protein